jgi:hypothetical protein
MNGKIYNQRYAVSMLGRLGLALFSAFVFAIGAFVVFIPKIFGIPMATAQHAYNQKDGDIFGMMGILIIAISFFFFVASIFAPAKNTN